MQNHFLIKMKKILYSVVSFVVITILSLIMVTAGNLDENMPITVISNRTQGTVEIKEILSDFELGADLVSIKLNDENEELDLEKLLNNIPEGKKIIIDNCIDKISNIREIVKENDSYDKIILRVKSSEKISDIENEFDFIKIYSGGIVFSAIKVANTADKFVQYQSKNYFNPFYQKIVTNIFDKKGLIAIAPTYDPDLCGQRQDNNTCWDELIDRGYNAFETNNLEALVTYRDAMNSQMEKLAELYNESYNSVGESNEYLNIYSQTSYKNYTNALSEARNSLNNLSSLARIQNAYSALKLAQDNLVPSSSNEPVRGAWNITVGKVIACILSGCGLILFELFLKKKKGRIKLY